MRLLFTSDLHGIIPAGIDPDQLLDELPGDDEKVFTDWESRPWNRYLDLALDARVRQIEGILHDSGKSVLFVLGNHDHRVWPGTPLVRDLHLRRVELGGQAFVGYRWANGRRAPREFEADIEALRPLVDPSTVIRS